MSTEYVRSGERPGFLTFISVCMIIGSVIGFFLSAFAVRNMRLDSSTVGTILTIGVGRSIFLLITGIGLFAGKNWARGLYIFMIVLNLLGSILLLNNRGNNSGTEFGLILGIAIAGLIIFYLYSEKCTLFFKREDTGFIPASKQWKCTYCDTLNPVTASTCSICDTENPEFKTGKWTCISCGTINIKTDIFCRGCGKYR